jgi:surface antigen
MIFPDFPSPAEAGFAKAGNRLPPRIKSGAGFFGIMLWLTEFCPNRGLLLCFEAGKERRFMPAAKIAIAAFVSLTLAACAGDPYAGTGPKENTGTLLGALTGAAVGSQFGGGAGSRVAAGVAGAAIGGLIGNRIGASLDDDDRARAYAAQMQALEAGPSGAPVSWRNPDSGRYGTVIPGPAYQQAGNTCRAYTHTIYIDGRPQTARGTACRNPDGTWSPIS